MPRLCVYLSESELPNPPSKAVSKAASKECHTVPLFSPSGVARTWFKVPSKNIKSESGAERLGLVSMHAGEVRGAVLDLFGTLSSL